MNPANTNAPNTVEVREFTCPACGSHAYGTSAPGYTDEAREGLSFEQCDVLFLRLATGCCHGYVADGPCRFTWPRTEDAKYFRPTGERMPSTLVATTGVPRGRP